MTNTKTPFQDAPVQAITDYEIDLRQVIAAFIRQKKLIAVVAGTAEFVDQEAQQLGVVIDDQ